MTSRRAEDKPRGPVVISIIIFAVVIISLLVYVLLALSTRTSSQVLEKQKDYTLSSKTIVKGLFSIASVDYGDPNNASCTLAESYLRSASVVLRMQPYEVPESCSFFVDGSLIKTERRLSPDCHETCDFPEFDRGISIGDLDYRDSHQVRVCCNSICIEQRINSLCIENGEPIVAAQPPQDKTTMYTVIGVGIGIILFVAIFLIVAHHQHKI